MKAKRIISNCCVRYLAYVNDTTKEERLQPEDVPVVKDYTEFFPKELPGLPPDGKIRDQTTTKNGSSI